MDNQIKTSSIESHRIDLELRESERETRERLRADEMAANEKLKAGLQKLANTLNEASTSLEARRNKASSIKAEIEQQIKEELRDAISSLKKSYAKKIGEEAERTAIHEKTIKSEIAYNNDLIINATDEKALELKKKQSILNGKLQVLVAKQIELSKLRMNSEQAIIDQAVRHETSIRQKYQTQLMDVQQQISHTESRIEKEKKKLEKSQNAALREESLLIKSSKIDFEESEKDREAQSAVEKMETLPADDPQLSLLHNKISEVHKSTASLKEKRDEISSTQNAPVEISEEADDADMFQGMEGDEDMPPSEGEEDPFSNSQTIVGDEGIQDDVGDSVNTTALKSTIVQNVPSQEQIKALEEAEMEVANINAQRERNDAIIKSLKQQIEDDTAKHLEQQQIAEEEQEKHILNVQHQSKMKEIKLKLQNHLISEAKLAKQQEEFKKITKELKNERQQIVGLKLVNAAYKLKLGKLKPASKVKSVEVRCNSQIEVVKKAQEEKLKAEKAKRERIENQAIEDSGQKLDESIQNIEQSRKQLEEKREMAVQQIAEVVKEKEQQNALVLEKKVSKNSLKALVFKQMKYLKALEGFDLQLQTLKMEEDKAKADHAAEVVKAKQQTRKSLNKLVHKNKRILNTIIKLNKEKEENELLKKKIQDGQNKEKQRKALKKKNRFSGLMKKHKTQMITNAKKERQLLAFKSGLESAREKREIDRATVAELRKKLEEEKDRFKKRSWIRIPERTEVLSATLLQSWIRGCNVRYQMPKFRREKAIADAKRNAAAGVIQKNWRGVLGRQKALFRQKLADMGMVYQWKRGNDGHGNNIDEEIDGVGVNTEPTLFTTNTTNKSTNQMMLLAGLGNVRKHPLNAPDSLMSTARSSKSDLSEDSIEEIKNNKGGHKASRASSGSLYRYTASSSNKTYLDDNNVSRQPKQLTPYTNSPIYPKRRDDLINQAIGILVGNEQY